jgi:hypothetical protein
MQVRHHCGQSEVLRLREGRTQCAFETWPASNLIRIPPAAATFPRFGI